MFKTRGYSLFSLMFFLAVRVFCQEDWFHWPDYQKPRAEYINYWQPYSPGPNTLALFHFDSPQPLTDSSPGKSVLTLTDDASFSPGRFQQALAVRKKQVRVNLAESLFAKNRFLIEFWFKIEKLPVTEIKIISRQHLLHKQNGLLLTLRADGSLFWQQVSSRVPLPSSGQKTDSSVNRFIREVTTQPHLVQPDTWHHLAVYAGGFMAFEAGDRISLWLDGQEVGRLDYGWYLEKEEQPTELALGGNDSCIFFDEFRIMTGIWRGYYPVPDDSFTDPEKMRKLESHPDYVAGEEEILFYASFDGTILPEKCAEKTKPVLRGEVTFSPGVRGKALSLGSRTVLKYPVEGNLSLSCGSLEMWVKPLGWSGDHRPQQQFLMIEDQTGRGRLYWYITNCGYMAPTSIFGGSGSPGSGTGYVSYPPDTWVHLVLTWHANICRLYVNGKQKISSLASQNFEEGFSAGYWQLPWPAPILVDELTVYSRDLSPLEVSNCYARYLPASKLKIVGEGRNLGSLSYVDFPGAGKIKVMLSLRQKTKKPSRVEISLQGHHKKIVTSVFPFSPAGTYLLEGIPFHPGQDLFVSACLFDTSGKFLGEIKTPFSRPEFPWLGNKIGLSDRVLKPWTPVKVVGNTVKVVGRDYVLSSAGLFQSIKDWGEEILTGPMSIKVMSTAGSFTASSRTNPVFLVQQDQNVSWKSLSRVRLPSGTLLFTVTGNMDYDGCAKFTIDYQPEDQPVLIEHLSLAIPLKNEIARTFSLCGSAPGKGTWKSFEPVLATNPGIVLKSSDFFDSWKMTAGSFLPMLWVGNDEYGLAYMADNDRGWVPSDNNPAITISRFSSSAEWVFHFISEPFLLKEKRTITLGFQATPVRPLPENWRSYCFHVPGVKLKLPEDFPHLPWGTFLSDAAGWDEAGVLDYPYQPEKTRQIIAEYHRNNLKATPHLDTSYLNWGWKKDTYSYFQEEWSSGGIPYNQIFTRSKIDWCLWSQKRWKEEFGIDGVYYDTGTPRPNYNTISGTAYQLPDGRVQPGWCVWGQREYFKRSAQFFGDLGVTNFTWGNGFYGPQVSGWQLGVVVGEQPERRPGITDYAQMGFSFEKHRLEAVSYKWGVIRLWQPPPDAYRGTEEDKKFIRSFYSQLLQFDCRTVFTSFGLPLCFAEFGVYRPETGFTGFWKSSEAVKIIKPASDAVVSFYQSGENLLLIVSNLSPTAKGIEIAIDLKKLDFQPDKKWQVFDPEEKEHLQDNEPAYMDHYRWARGGHCLLPAEERNVSLTLQGQKALLQFKIEGKDFRTIWWQVAPPEKQEDR